MKRCFEFKYIPCNNNDSNRRAIYRRMTGRERGANRSSILWSSIIKRAIKVIRILWAPAIILIEVYCCRPHLVHFTAAAADVTTIGLAQRCTKNVSEKRSKAPAEEKKKKNKSRIKCLLSPAAMNLWLSVISIPSSSRSCG